jgi:hypothetical protein
MPHSAGKIKKLHGPGSAPPFLRPPEINALSRSCILTRSALFKGIELQKRPTRRIYD